MNSFSPVVIPTLNRHGHLKHCIESLARCTHADKTELFIFLDYPLNSIQWEGYILVKKYLPLIKGFKKVNIIERTRNFGAKENYLMSMEYMFERYDRLIFTEDDNQFSPSFLDYMNKGLKVFENNRQIYAICGFKYPFIDNEESPCIDRNYFYSKTFSAWGCGIWRNKYLLRKRNYSPNDLFSFLKDFENLRQILKMAPSKIKSLLISVYKNKELYGDSIVSLENIKFDTFCIFPTISTVRNFGHDGTGVNGGVIKNSLYDKVPIDENITFNFIERHENEFDKKIQKKIQKHFYMSLKDLILLPLVLILILLKNPKNEIRTS